MRPLLFSLLCFFSQVCFGQINLSLSNVSTKQALQELAAQAHVKFFYKPEHIDTTFVSTELHNATLENALNKILPPLGFSYVQYDDYNIVLIKDQSIKTRMSGTRSRELISATVGTNEANPNKNNITLSGYVKDAKSGEPVIGALVHLTAINQGAATNLFGFYSVEVPYGRHRLKVTYVGYEDEIIDLNALSSGSLDIEIFESTTELEEVIITSEAEDINVQGTQTGLSKLSIQTIKNLPAFLGEVDLVKSMLLLPGVSTVGEGASGFNVRGGDVSQNLILLDDALIFNSSHLFGFFSVFHPDLVKEVTLYKGGIPSYYGGRLAAVMDVKLKEGNNKKVISKGSLGLISGKLAVEGPVNQGKGSFIIGARASFLNWMLKKTKNVSLATSRGGYNDITGKMTYSLGDKDKLYLTFYNSSDHFQLTSDNTFGVINTAQTFRWTHAFGSKLFASLTGVNGSTRTDISNDIPPDAFTMSSGINYQNMKMGFYYTPNYTHKIDFGLDVVMNRINPGTYTPDLTIDNNDPINLEKDRSVESSIYFSDEMTVSGNLSFIAGARFSYFSRLGPGTSYNYQNDVPKDIITITDTLTFGRYKPIASYRGIEPRLSLKYSYTPFSSVKISYHKMYQYLHLLSNTAAITPLDYWTSSNQHLSPEIGDQYSLGLFNNLFNNRVETSAEVYYKAIENVIDYKDGGDIILNQTIETDLLSGTGRAYGMEFSLRKKTGKLNGWLGYSYSKSERQIKGPTKEETINEGRYYPSNFDKPHDAVVAINYSFTKRARLSLNYVYNSGRPISVPISKYQQGQFYALLNYSDRNMYRIPDYHRLDLAFTLDEGHKITQKYKSSWTFSIYNLYARKNAYSIFFNTYGNAFKLSVLGTILPSITYNFTIY